MSKFHIFTQILQENALFSGKIYTAGKKLHNRRLWWSWQIPSLIPPQIPAASNIVYSWHFGTKQHPIHRSIDQFYNLLKAKWNLSQFCLLNYSFILGNYLKSPVAKLPTTPRAAFQASVTNPAVQLFRAFLGGINAVFTGQSQNFRQSESKFRP